MFSYDWDCCASFSCSSSFPFSMILIITTVFAHPVDVHLALFANSAMFHPTPPNQKQLQNIVSIGADGSSNPHLPCIVSGGATEPSLSFLQIYREGRILSFSCAFAGWTRSYCWCIAFFQIFSIQATPLYPASCRTLWFFAISAMDFEAKCLPQGLEPPAKPPVKPAPKAAKPCAKTLTQECSQTCCQGGSQACSWRAHSCGPC